MYKYIILSTFFYVNTAFTPIWIGKPCEFVSHVKLLFFALSSDTFVYGVSVRESSLLSYEESEEISNKCGFSSKANSSHYPWAVSLLLHDQHRLGGTIISPYHILTVAHGFMKFQMGSGSSCLAAAYRSIDDLHQRVVVYGGQCIRGESDDHPNHPDCYKADVYKNKIRSVLLNGDFAAQQCQNGNDIAIIELEHSIKFNERVSPICLPSVRPTIQKTLMVSGWGRSDIFKESGPKIHEVPMMVDKFCRRPWSDKLPHEAADLLCATSMNPTDYNTPRICHGDSGSGMEQRDPKGRATLIAMTSFGTTGCPANMLGRFTRVDHYLKPICNYTGLCYSSLEATTL
ncbi:unnamed protein product [Auanema sp. JU1783]|nr:unnamed protein product [Auanema sp. JU1783]